MAEKKQGEEEEEEFLLTLTEEVVEDLRREAEKRHISIFELTDKIIKEELVPKYREIFNKKRGR